jgi:hypothetical protein
LMHRYISCRWHLPQVILRNLASIA